MVSKKSVVNGKSEFMRKFIRASVYSGMLLKVSANAERLGSSRLYEGFKALHKTSKSETSRSHPVCLGEVIRTIVIQKAQTAKGFYTLQD